MADTRSPFASLNKDVANQVASAISDEGCGEKLDIFSNTTSSVINTLFAERLQNRLKEKIVTFILQTKPEERAKAQQLLNAHPELYQDHEFITQLILCYTICGQKEAAHVLKNMLPKALLESKAFQTKLFFLYTVYGQQEAARELLIEHPGLVLETTPFITDGSNRTFDKNITAFQYALWANDSYMAAMMLSCFERLKDGLAAAKAQSDALEKYGLNYVYDDRRIYIKKSVVGEKHFKFEPLINELDTYVKNYDLWTPEQCVTQWCKKVGVEQRGLPMHVIQEYCNQTESFNPCPSFEKLVFDRNTAFYNWLVSANQSVYRLVDSDLGINRGLGQCLASYPLRCVLGGGQQRGGLWPGNWATVDLAAIRHLSTVRTKDMEDINAYLANPTSHPLPDHLKHQAVTLTAEPTKSYQPQ